MNKKMNLKENNIKTTIGAVLAVVVLVASTSSTARWHNPSQGASAGHGHSKMDMDHSSMKGMKDMDHSKMSACEHEMMNMDHSKMSETEHADMKKCDDEKAEMKGMDHSEMEMDHSKMGMGHH